MPENAWQESRDTGLRHLSVGVALYAGLCSGFILLYAPAFLSLLSLFERKEGIMEFDFILAYVLALFCFMLLLF